jgi:hypothetical protein
MVSSLSTGALNKAVKYAILIKTKQKGMEHAFSN